MTIKHSNGHPTSGMELPYPEFQLRYGGADSTGSHFEPSSNAIIRIFICCLGYHFVEVNQGKRVCSTMNEFDFSLNLKGDSLNYE